MPQQKTALLTVWPHNKDRSGGQAALHEHFRPTWRSTRTIMTAVPDEALLVGFAAHFAAYCSPVSVQLPPPRQPLVLTQMQWRRLLAAYTGREATLLRYDGCVINDEQVDAVRACGLHLDVIDILGHAPSSKALGR